MSRWWRFYDDAINDPKLLRLPDELYRAWTILLCLASKNGGTLPSADDIALTLRMKPAKVAEWITKLTKGELLDNKSGVFSPHNWDGRQFKSDTSNDRVKRHRETKRNVTSSVTCNVTEGVTSTVTVTAPEAEAESDTEQSRADASPLVDEDLKRRASSLAAGISAHFVSRNFPIPNLDRCLLWLTQGYAQGTILTAVETVLKRGKPIATLEYFDGAVKDAHAKAPPPANLKAVSSQFFVIVGTLAHACWDKYSRETGGRGFPTTQKRVDNVLQEGWYQATEFPPGYDEQTGEKLDPANEDAA